MSFAEWEEIALGRVAGESIRGIGGRVARDPSTISQMCRNVTIVGGYRASTAHTLAYEQPVRLKLAKLVSNQVLRRRGAI